MMLLFTCQTHSTTNGSRTMASTTLFQVSQLSDAVKVRDTYQRMGYTVEVNQNAAAWIDSPVRTDDLFLVAVTK